MNTPTDSLTRRTSTTTTPRGESPRQPARTNPRERDYGTGYGRSSGYARSSYIAASSPALFRCR